MASTSNSASSGEPNAELNRGASEHNHMKVFLSWSGSLSHQFADALHSWLPDVIQAVQPFLSSEDIESGERWSLSLGKELETNAVGIICATRANVAEPWINFEAGALSKALDSARVIPLLLDLKKSELADPLGQFQALTATEDDMFRLVGQLNGACAVPIEPGRLRTTFDRWWPDLHHHLQSLVDTEKPPPADQPMPPFVDQDEILEDILDLVRQQHRLLTSTVPIRVADRTVIPVESLNLLSRAFNVVHPFHQYLTGKIRVTPEFADAVSILHEAMEQVTRFGDVKVADDWEREASGTPSGPCGCRRAP